SHRSNCHDSTVPGALNRPCCPNCRKRFAPSRPTCPQIGSSRYFSLNSIVNVWHMTGRAHRVAITSAAALAGAVLVLSGCSTSPPPTPPPSADGTGSNASPSSRAAPTRGPTATATLSSQQQKAADAAIAAFKKYLRVSDAVMRDGGHHPERLKEVATGV